MRTFDDRARELDAGDELAGFRDRFHIEPGGPVYLDGNSLGRLPLDTADRLDEHVRRGWGERLIRGWEEWTGLPLTVGDVLGRSLLGAAPGETVVCDTTTTNLYKLALAAVRHSGRPVILTDDDNFPTDRYVLAEVARLTGSQLRVLPTDRDDGLQLDTVTAALDADVALVSLCHVSYRSGALAPLRAISEAARAAGALTLWDLSHSVGSVPVDLSRADLAVGCSYKYLNGGPGAPAWLWVRSGLELHNPVPGWFGAADPFAMDEPYRPAAAASRFLTGTPSVAGLLAVDVGVRLLAEAGLDRLRAKSIALTGFLVELVDDLLVPLGFRLATPRDPARRGAHVTLEHPRARALVDALARRGVVVDYRDPSRLRIGPAPLYTRFADLLTAVRVLAELS